MVKRYDISCFGGMHMDECGDGAYVNYEDYAELESKLETALRECRSAGITIDNLEAKCEALAAENSWMKEYLVVEATPATDDFLAEARAQGVEMFAASLEVVGGGEHPYSAVANEFATQLRKGGNQ